MPSERRGFVGWLLSGGLFGSIASFIYPALRFVNPPNLPEASVNEVTAGKAADFKLNTGKIVRFGNKPALLVRVNETEFKAFSAICTHLNCTVQYHDERHQIWCACHNGFYDLNGRVVSGPPPKPLEEYAVRLKGEEVVISKQS